MNTVTWSHKPIVRIPISYLPVIADAFLWISTDKEGIQDDDGNLRVKFGQGKPRKGVREQQAT
jgi:hypothetical protein